MGGDCLAAKLYPACHKRGDEPDNRQHKSRHTSERELRTGIFRPLPPEDKRQATACRQLLCQRLPLIRRAEEKQRGKTRHEHALLHRGNSVSARQCVPRSARHILAAHPAPLPRDRTAESNRGYQHRHHSAAAHRGYTDDDHSFPAVADYRLQHRTRQPHGILSGRDVGNRTLHNLRGNILRADAANHRPRHLVSGTEGYKG